MVTDEDKGGTWITQHTAKIPPGDFRWYAAFHGEGEHPHIHIDGLVRKAGTGLPLKERIRQIKSKLTNDIFRNENAKVPSEPLGGKPSALCDAGSDPVAPPHESDLPGQLRPKVPPRQNPDRPQAAEKAAGEAHGHGAQASRP